MLITEKRLFKDVIDILEEDKEWWLKRRPQDKKNLRILIGKSAKGGRHVKKGGPFTKDPPKYKGNKGSPGLGLLQEEFSINTLKSLKIGEEISITPKKDLDYLFTTVMKKGTTYFITKTKEESFSINPPVAGRKVVSLSDLESMAGDLNPDDFIVNKEKSKKTLMKTEISPNQQEDIAKKLTKKHIPGASKGFISKVGDWFKGSVLINTIGDVIKWFKKLWNKFTGGGDKEGGKEVTADQAADLNLSYKNLWRKFGGFDEYVNFLWKQFDDHRDEISSWSRSKIDSRIREVAKKYDIPAYVLLGIMHGESNLKPVGIHTQTMSNPGDPKIAISKNSSAYGMGQVVGSSYDKIKHDVGVPHYMLWNPYYGIDAVGALVKLLIKNRCKGETICYRAMRSYAGTTAGGHRKMASIAKWQKKENA